MTNSINANQFNFNFFLGGRKKVKSLSDGAMQYGGATQFKNNIYSNVEASDLIEVNDINNTLALFVPSTLDTDKKIDNTNYVLSTIQKIQNRYNLKNIVYYDTSGSWYSDDMQKVIIEDITIIQIDLQKVNELDIKFFQKLALEIKKVMSQEGVSFTINDALAIV